MTSVMSSLVTFLIHLQTGYNLRRHKLTVKCTKSSKLNSYLHFFCNRVSSVWNSLPEIIVPVCANSLSAFKSKLKKFDLRLTAYCIFDFAHFLPSIFVF